MFKILGILIIIFTSTLLGIFLGNKNFFKIKNLLELKKALFILQSEISYIKNPLNQALYNVSIKLQEPFRSLFSVISQNLEENNIDDIGEFWKIKSLEILKNTYLDNDDIYEISNFGNCLGYLNSDMQKNNIFLTINYIDEKISNLNLELTKNKKMFNSLGILVGILICVILI